MTNTNIQTQKGPQMIIYIVQRTVAVVGICMIGSPHASLENAMDDIQSRANSQAERNGSGTVEGVNLTTVQVNDTSWIIDPVLHDQRPFLITSHVVQPSCKLGQTSV